MHRIYQNTMREHYRPQCCSSRKEVVQTAGTLHDPDHLDTIGDDAVEDEIAAHGKIAAVHGDVQSCWPQLRVVSSEGACVLDLLQEAVCCSGIVLRDIQPEIDQIFFRLRCPSDHRHIGLLSLLKATSGFGLDRLHIPERAIAALDALLPQTP